MFMNKKYLATLENQIRELKERCGALERENRQLYARLLERNNVLPIPAEAPSIDKLDPRGVAGLLSTAPIFGPDEFDGDYDYDELTDNRKGSEDAFVS